jgi:hypothetical protein
MFFKMVPRLACPGGSAAYRLRAGVLVVSHGSFQKQDVVVASGTLLPH